MVAERKSKSFASVACVARGRISAWETVLAPAIGGSMGNAVTQLARTLDARHAVSTTTSLAKAAEALRYLVEGRPFGRVLLAI
jgi:NADPH:quinone reductase-like Zn-dependent oxidoreductase